MLFDNKLNKTPTNQIKLNSSFSLSTTTSPRIINSNNANNHIKSLSFDNGIWNKNIKNNSIDTTNRINPSSGYIIKLFLSLSEEVLRICKIENIENNNFIDLYNKVSEIKENLYDIGLKKKLYRNDKTNLFENENCIKNGILNHNNSLNINSNSTMNGNNNTTIEEHFKKPLYQCYTPTSILSNTCNAYSPYKDEKYYFEINKITKSPINIHTPQTSNNGLNNIYSNQNQNSNIKTILNTSPNSNNGYSNIFNNKSSLLNIYDININDYINNNKKTLNYYMNSSGNTLSKNINNIINSNLYINNSCSINNNNNKSDMDSSNFNNINNNSISNSNMKKNNNNINININKNINKSNNDKNNIIINDNNNSIDDNHNNSINTNKNKFNQKEKINNKLDISYNVNNSSNDYRSDLNIFNNKVNNNNKNTLSNTLNNISTETETKPISEYKDDDNDNKDIKENIFEIDNEDKDTKNNVLIEDQLLNKESDQNHQEISDTIENDYSIKEKKQNIKALKEKLENADKLRMNMLNKRIEKSKVKSQKINELKLKRQSSDKDLMKQLQKKQDEAAKKRRIHINTIKYKAKDECQKSNEVVFIQAMSLEHKKIEVIRRQEESIARKEKIDQTKLQKITRMNELQKINTERRKILNEIRAQKFKTQHEKKWKLNKRKDIEKKLNNFLNKRLVSEQQTKRINEFKNSLIIEEEELRKEINNKVEMASKRHAEQIELVKEKAAAVIKHSKTVAERTINKQKEEIKLNEEDKELYDSLAIDLPIATINKNIRKRNKFYKKEFIKIIQEKIKENQKKEEDQKENEMNNTNDSDNNNIIRMKLNEISYHFSSHDSDKYSNEELKQLNSDINYLTNLNDKYKNEIIKSNVLISILEGCLRIENNKWLLSLKLIYQCVSLIDKKYNDEQSIKSFIYSCDPVLFNMINIQSRLLLLLDSKNESDDKLTLIIDLIKISTIFYKFISSVLYYTRNNNDIHKIIVKYVFNTSVFKPVNIKFNIKELYLQDSPLNDFYYFASILYYNISFINDSWEKPIYEKYQEIENDNDYFNNINSEIINDFIIMMDSILLYKGCGHSINTKLSNKMLEISLNVLKTLNNISAINSESIMTLLNMEIMQNQLFHFISFWLDYWFMWVYPTFTEEKELENSENENNNSNSHTDTKSVTYATASILTEILHELLLTIGFFCLFSKESKSILRLGQRPVILQKLINLPLQYYIHPQYYEILFPTLIISCYNEPNNQRVLQDNFSSNYLVKYLKDELQQYQSSNTSTPSLNESSELNQSISNSTSSSEYNKNNSNYDNRFKLINRFPITEWENAITYFSKKD